MQPVETFSPPHPLLPSTQEIDYRQIFSVPILSLSLAACIDGRMAAHLVHVGRTRDVNHSQSSTQREEE